MSGNNEAQTTPAIIDNPEIQNSKVIAETKLGLMNGREIDIFEVINLLDKNAVTLKQRKELGELFGMTSTEVKHAISAFIRRDKIQDQLGSVPKNQYEFVEAILEKWDTKMTYQGVFTIKNEYRFDKVLFTEETINELPSKERTIVTVADPKTITYKEMFPLLIKTAVEMGFAFKDKEIDHALSDWMWVRKNMLISYVVADNIYDPNIVTVAEKEWDKFIIAITDDNVDETKAVMKHFIWQAKRKMFGKPVKFHMMPILYGRQGSGKSTIVKDLTGPVKDFKAEVNFGQIGDDRDHALWSNLILVFDEMGNSTTTNLEIIKQRLTSDTFTARVMNTNTNSLITNRTTSIGTTNKSLTRLIFDETGMRRFYQINCKDNIDWKVTESINYAMLWQSINENADSDFNPNNPIFAKVQKIQNESRFITIIEAFLEQRSYNKCSIETIRASVLFDEFQQFEKTQTPRPEMTQTKFGRDLKDIHKHIPGLTIKKYNQGGFITYDIEKI